MSSITAISLTIFLELASNPLRTSDGTCRWGYEGRKLAKGVVERCREGSRMVEREGRDHKRAGS